MQRVVFGTGNTKHEGGFILPSSAKKDLILQNVLNCDTIYMKLKLKYKRSVKMSDINTRLLFRVVLKKLVSTLFLDAKNLSLKAAQVVMPKNMQKRTAFPSRR